MGFYQVQNFILDGKALLLEHCKYYMTNVRNYITNVKCMQSIIMIWINWLSELFGLW